MDRRRCLALLSGATCAVGMPRVARAADLAADEIFGRAKSAWHARVEVPFVTFSLRERYEWRKATHDNWWLASYRDADGALALRRLIVPADEQKRMRGSAIALNFRWHQGFGRADSLDTSADADAFPILDPRIEPNASFGLLRREQKASLVGANPRSPASPAPVAAASTAPAVATPNAANAANAPLRELARVEAVARDYAIAIAGTETVRGVDAYHLTLTPLRAPAQNRLRDLWIDATTFATLRLAMQGLFEGKPYADARWIVTYVALEGRNYVQEIRTDDTLRFGLDRYVSGLSYDFVSYAFPPAVPEITFERLL